VEQPIVPVSLHNHSEYSLLDSGCTVEELAGAAAKAGMEAVGLTDRNSISGCVAFFRACSRQQPQIHPVLGCEIDTDTGHPLVVLAENDEGYRSLCDLLSRSTHDFVPLSLERIGKSCEGLVALTGGTDAQIPTLLRQAKFDAARDAALRLAEIFPGRCYVELFRHRPADSVLCARLAEVADRAGLPMVACANTRYLRKADHRKYQIAASIRTLTLFHQPAPGKFLEADGSFHFLSPAGYRKWFSAFPGALENSVHIARRCRIPLLERAV
jgi:DNA polymerase III alpha subunit